MTVVIPDTLAELLRRRPRPTVDEVATFIANLGDDAWDYTDPGDEAGARSWAEHFLGMNPFPNMPE